MSQRRIIHDNLGTEMAPTPRARIFTPLTPRAVRDELVKQAVDEGPGWLERRMTPLDKLLSDDEADALERWAMCEAILAGNARCGDYTGDRVMTSRDSGLSPIPDKWLITLGKHASVKVRLPEHVRRALALFSEQQAGSCVSDAQAGLALGLKARRKDEAWRIEVQGAAEVLVGTGY